MDSGAIHLMGSFPLEAERRETGWDHKLPNCSQTKELNPLLNYTARKLTLASLSLPSQKWPGDGDIACSPQVHSALLCHFDPFAIINNAVRNPSVTFWMLFEVIYLCSRSCPPCIWRAQSLPVSHSQRKTLGRFWQRCPCRKHAHTHAHAHTVTHKEPAQNFIQHEIDEAKQGEKE